MKRQKVNERTGRKPPPMTEFRFLSLSTAHLQATADFYQQALELPLLARGAKYAVFQVGATQLMWEQAESGDPFYHFAFDIPCNRLTEAADWMQNRAELLTREGNREFEFEDWKASSIYFHDPSGNIVEFIARRNLQNQSEQAFSPEQLLRVSEIGWPTSEADPAPATELKAWRDYGAFKALGDETALLLVVPEGRGWLPTGRPAEIHPCSLVIAHQDRFLKIKRAASASGGVVR